MGRKITQRADATVVVEDCHSKIGILRRVEILQSLHLKWSKTLHMEVIIRKSERTKLEVRPDLLSSVALRPPRMQ
jgi:hypothetical protein